MDQVEKEIKIAHLKRVEYFLEGVYDLVDVLLNLGKEDPLITKMNDLCFRDIDPNNNNFPTTIKLVSNLDNFESIETIQEYFKNSIDKLKKAGFPVSIIREGGMLHLIVDLVEIFN